MNCLDRLSIDCAYRADNNVFDPHDNRNDSREYKKTSYQLKNLPPDHILFSLKQRLSKYLIMKHSNFFLFIFMMTIIALTSIQAAPIENAVNNKRHLVQLFSESKNDNNDLIKRNEMLLDKHNIRAHINGVSKGGETSSTASDPPEIGCGTECKRNEVKEIDNKDLMKRNEQEDMKKRFHI